MNIYKDIFLLDNKAKMKYAVDRMINNSNEVFDAVKYQKKVDNEKEEEINEAINKKIEEYNNLIDKAIYEKKINNERKQMLHNNLINKLEYKKYRNKLNNQIISLPKIFIQPTKPAKNRQIKKTTEKDKTKSDNKSNRSGKKSAYVNNISEETVNDFGTSIHGNDQYRTKMKREINPRSETYIELPDINKSKKSVIPLTNKSLNKENEGEGKERLIKAIQEKEEREKSKSSKSKKTNTKKSVEEEKKEEEDEKEKEKNS